MKITSNKNKKKIKKIKSKAKQKSSAIYKAKSVIIENKE
jgi:hypothetical protein